ncbi:hypothetical protein LTR62_003986 [Meristemomyces frigidus]|uniref:F-box domain-containing protein n=1 Tax=Meristemomyces frigidus TaxID=1508187 RepID=A0AAN7TPG8_9PEZI|nr:hypothetical protein LTR62_003986 [Meristemomyces frigidus]
MHSEEERIMPLLNLPAELLVHITTFATHTDLENLCLSCRTLYEVGKETLVRHRAYKRRWRYFRLEDRRRTVEESDEDSEGGDDETEDGGDDADDDSESEDISSQQAPDSIFHLLAAIEKDSTVASYVDTLDLWTDDQRFRHSVPVSRATREAIKRLVARSAFTWPVDLSDQIDAFHQTDEMTGADGSTGMLITLLLSLLPNIRVLGLPWIWWDIMGSWRDEAPAGLEILEAVITRAKETTDAPLSKLRTLLPYASIIFDSDNSLFELSPFFNLKNLHELYASNMQAENGEECMMPITFHWPQEVEMCCLRKIELIGCSIDAPGIEELVSHTPLLEHFAYSHTTKRSEVGHGWNPGEFVAVIGAYCGNTLTFLAITIQDLADRPENGVASMHEFTALIEAELDIDLFDGPPIWSGRTRREDGGDWDRSYLEALVGMMPPSVEKIKLWVNVQHNVALYGRVTKGASSRTVLGRLLSGLEDMDTSAAPFDLTITSDLAPKYWRTVLKVLDCLGVRDYPRWVGKNETGRKPEWEEKFVERFGHMPTPIWPSDFHSPRKLSICTRTDLRHLGEFYSMRPDETTPLFALPQLKELNLSFLGYLDGDGEDFGPEPGSYGVEKLRLSSR